MDSRYLFRGKRTNDGEWVIGYLTKQRHSPLDPSYSAPYNLEYVIDHEDNGIMLTSFIDPLTKGQCTGLPDKNGVYAFEGDIIKAHYANAKKSNHVEVIVFQNGKYVAECKIGDIGKSWSLLADGIRHLAIDKTIYMDEFEIIGNIYDNPELLEVNA